MQAGFSNQHPLRLAVLISGGGSTLANLINHIDDGRLRNTRIVLVISSRGAVRGVDIAREAGLPVRIIRSRDFADAAAHSEAITAACDQATVDLAVMGGFLCLWDYPARYEGRILNIHPSLLPRHGGKGLYGHRVHQAVLRHGDSESGCSVHLVDHEYDHGPIIGQRRVPVLPDDDPDTLAQRVGVQERELYPQIIQRVADHGLEWLKHAGSRTT